LAGTFNLNFNTERFMNLIHKRHSAGSVLANSKVQKGLALGALAMVGALALAAAGTGGNQQFGQLATQLQGWAQGSLGIVIATAALLVGLSIGVVKQSLMAVVTGVGIAIALYYGPTVIVGVLSAAGGIGHVQPLIGASLPILG
jgi:conjugal transfer pilus assembly protein TraA